MNQPNTNSILGSLNADQPIGIFDSGVGGLTLAHALTQKLPKENIIFFGDTLHLPFGDKSAASIRHYSTFITQELIDKGCKCIIVACNTASSIAYDYLQKHFGHKVHIINVIDPVINHCLAVLKAKKIGVIGTKGTIRSRSYPKRFKKTSYNVEVVTASTPLIAPMVEEGFFNNTISSTIIHAYLSKKNLQGIEAMILACTHYPLIRNEIEAYYKGKVHVVDNIEATLNQTKTLLEKSDLLRKAEKDGIRHFFVSDFTTSFQKTGELFFGKSIKLEKWNLWR